MRRSALLIHLVAAQLAAAAAPAAAALAAPAEAAPAITVTGHRLKDYAAALDGCVVAHCPPRQDIVASVRYAEALFKVGDYHGAREVLAKATHRNAGFGAQEPLALSQLYLAQANVAAHFGEQRDVASATIASARVADDYLPAGDRDRLFADLRLADWRLMSQSLERTKLNRAIADPDYVRIAAAARAAGHPDIAAAADLHHAWALHARRDDDGALALLATVDGGEGAVGHGAAGGDTARPYRLAARVLTARIARARGDRHAIDAVIAAMRADPDSHGPILVFSPPMPRPTDPAYQADPTAIQTDLITRPGDYSGLQWVDIGFSIRSDGSVDDPEVLRGSRQADWARPLLGWIAARRYSPTTGDEAAPGHYRVERFTLTADFQTPVGSLIRRRISAPRYEQLDLTDGEPKRG